MTPPDDANASQPVPPPPLRCSRRTPAPAEYVPAWTAGTPAAANRQPTRGLLAPPVPDNYLTWAFAPRPADHPREWNPPVRRQQGPSSLALILGVTLSVSCLTVFGTFLAVLISALG